MDYAGNQTCLIGREAHNRSGFDIDEEMKN